MRGSRRRAALSSEKSEGHAAVPDQGKGVAPGAAGDAGRDAAGAEKMAEQHGEHDGDDDAFQRRSSGAIVSSRAKKAGDSAFTSTCAGRPSASQISACEVAWVSAEVNAPCSNNSRTIGSLSAINPSVAGSASPTASSSARDSRCAIAALVAAPQRARQFRDQHRSHGDADDAERQLDQAVGEIEP